VVASHRQIEALRKRENTALDFAHAAPVQIGRIVILLIAGDLTTVAPDAFRHIEMKAVLLALREWPGWNQRRLRAVVSVDICASCRRKAEEWIVFADPFFER